MRSGPASSFGRLGRVDGDASAVDSADAGNELAEPEGLDDVVVGRHLEQQNPVDLVIPCGHDDDRHSRSVS